MNVLHNANNFESVFRLCLFHCRPMPHCHCTTLQNLDIRNTLADRSRSFSDIPPQIPISFSTLFRSVEGGVGWRKKVSPRRFFYKTHIFHSPSIQSFIVFFNVSNEEEGATRAGIRETFGDRERELRVLLHTDMHACVEA